MKEILVGHNRHSFFTPIESLRYGINYRVGIDRTAQDTYGKQLSKDFNSEIATEPGRFLFLGRDQQLYASNLKGDVEQLTSDIRLVDYFVYRGGQKIILRNYDPNTTLPRFTIFDLESKELTPVLNEFVGQIYFASFDEKTGTLFFNFDDSSTPDHTRTLYAYDITTDTYSKIDLDNPFVYAFWLLPDGNTLLVQDLESRYFIYDINTKEHQLVGTYLEYAGSSSYGDILYFRKSGATSNIVAVSIDSSKEITGEEIMTALPSINDEGDLLAFSYKPLPENSEEIIPNFRLRIISLEDDTVFKELVDSNTSFEYATFSPNSQYLALTTTSRIQGEPSGRIIPSLLQKAIGSNLTETIKIYDVLSDTFLEIQLEGSMVRWL